MDRVTQKLLRFISDTPPLLSLLYDIDLMPEQLECGSTDWAKMLRIARAFAEFQHKENE